MTESKQEYAVNGRKIPEFIDTSGGFKAKLVAITNSGTAYYIKENIENVEVMVMKSDGTVVGDHDGNVMNSLVDDARAGNIALIAPKTEVWLKATYGSELPPPTAYGA